MIAPCKDCTDRHVGCHIECEKYQAFREDRIRIYEEKDEQKRIDDTIWRTRNRIIRRKILDRSRR